MKIEYRIAAAAIVTAGILISSSVATAAEKNLEFQLIIKALDPKVIEVPNLQGQAITQSKGFGVGVFKDGRIAVKDIVFVTDLNKGVGSMFGYSTYNFDDGSSITARFTAEFKANLPVHGEYKILSGTGTYVGATGTGTLDSIPNQFKGANLYKVQLKVVTP